MSQDSAHARKSFFTPAAFAAAALALALLRSAAMGDAAAEAPRRVVSLGGAWQIAAGSPEGQPAEFARTIPVPGVVDMAAPPFENVGRKTKFADEGGHKFTMVPDLHYRAFWYRRTFTVEGDVPAVAVLKLAKTKFGTRVWLNGHELGRHRPCFTPGYFDVRRRLKGGGQDNELIVCVGADPLSVGDHAANGYDFEKRSYLAGIYDDVTLTLTGSPYVVNVQVVPEIEESTARVVAEIGKRSDRPVATTPPPLSTTSHAVVWVSATPGSLKAAV